MQYGPQLLLHRLVARDHEFVGHVPLDLAGELVELTRELVPSGHGLVEHPAHQAEELVLPVFAYQYVQDLSREQRDFVVVAVVAHQRDHGAAVAGLGPVHQQRVAQRAHVDHRAALLLERPYVGFGRYGRAAGATVPADEFHGHEVFEEAFVDELYLGAAVGRLDIAQYRAFGLVEQFGVSDCEPSLLVDEARELVERCRRVVPCLAQLRPVDAVGRSAVLVLAEYVAGYREHYLVLLPAGVGMRYPVGHVGEQGYRSVRLQFPGERRPDMVGAGYLEYQGVLEPDERDLGQGAEVPAHLVEVLVDVPGASELLVAESVNLGVLAFVPAEHQGGVALHLELEQGLPRIAPAGEKQLETRIFRADEQLPESFVQRRRTIEVVGGGVLVAEAFVHGVEEDVDLAPFLVRPFVQLADYLRGVFPRGAAENAAQRVRKALAGEIGTAEDEHRVVAPRYLFGPPAELVGLALSGFSEQGEESQTAGAELFKQRAEHPPLHEELAVVFLLTVDAAEEAGGFVEHQRAHLGPVHLLRYVEGAAAALEQAVEVGVQAVAYVGDSLLVGGDEGDFLVLERLEHIDEALVVAEHQRIQVGFRPVGRAEHAAALPEAETELLKRLQGLEHGEYLRLQREDHAPVDFVGERGAVALVFVAHPHHARLGLGAEKPVRASVEERRTDRTHERTVGKLPDRGPDYGIEDVVHPVAEGERALGVDLVDYGLHRPGALGQLLLGVLQQHEQAAARELHADFEKIEGVVHACGEILLLHFANQ